MSKKETQEFVTNTENLLKNKSVRGLLDKLPDVGNKGGVLANIVGFLNLESRGGKSVKGAGSIRGAFQQAAGYITEEDKNKANALLKEVGSFKRFAGNTQKQTETDLMNSEKATAMFVAKYGSKKFMEMFSSEPEEAYKKYQQGSGRGYTLLKRGYKEDPTRLDLAHGLVRIKNQVSKLERVKVVAALRMLRGSKRNSMPKQRGKTKPNTKEMRIAKSLLNKYDKFTKEKIKPKPGQIDVLREAGFPAYSGKSSKNKALPQSLRQISAKEQFEMKKAASRTRAKAAADKRGPVGNVIKKVKDYFKGK
jgi:hypothetical protein